MDNFKSLLPIDIAKYALLISDKGLDGYKLANAMSGNVILVKDNVIIKSLNGDKQSEIINELNELSKGGKLRTRRNRKRKKSRKNRRKSYHHRR